MRPSIIITRSALLGIAVLLLGSGCRRKDDEKKVTPGEDVLYASLASEHSQDESQIQTETNDIARELGDYYLANRGGRVSSTTILCGSGVVSGSGTGVGRVDTVTFSGASNGCYGVNRVGQVVFRLVSGSRFADAGAMLEVRYLNLRVTRPGGRQYTLAGTHWVTNVSGGSLLAIPSGGNITHKIRGSLSLTFGNGSTRSWRAFRRVIYTQEGSNNYQIESRPDTSLGGYSDVAAEGITRTGQSFLTRITSPIVVKGSCDYFRPISGAKVHQVESRTLSVEMGRDSQGNTVAAGSCASHYRVTYSSNNRSYSVVLPYN